MYRERRLPPSEAQRVLARALELQRAQGGGRELGDEEVARVLRDLGVEERFVQRALADDETAAADVSEKPNAFFGSPLRVVLEQRIGRAIDREDHPRLVQTLRRVVGEDGQAEIVGDEVGFTLQSGRKERKFLRVKLEPSAGGTTIRVEENLRAVAGGLFGGILGALGANGLVWAILGPLLFHAPLWLPFLLIGAWLTAWTILRASYGAYVRKRRRHLGEIMEKVSAVAASDSGRVPLRVDEGGRARIATEDTGEEAASDVDQAAPTRRTV